jgi:hypothetical protein
MTVSIWYHIKQSLPDMPVCVNVFDQFAGLLFGISTRTQPAKQSDFVRLIHRLSFGFSLKNLVAFRDCEYLSGHAATSSAESKVTSSSGVGCSELSASTSLSA